jgi:hypothetical protein
VLYIIILFFQINLSKKDNFAYSTMASSVERNSGQQQQHQSAKKKDYEAVRTPHKINTN